MGDLHEFLVVLDTETTGLEPSRDQILELAFIVLDNVTLEEVTRASIVVRPRKLDLMAMDPFVIKMHQDNGLLLKCRESLSLVCDAEVDAIATLRHVLENHPGARLHLAGNCVHFGRAFLRVHMPSLEALFHHRHADASAARVVLGAPSPASQSTHRALADCEAAVSEIRALRATYLKGLS